MMEREFFVPDNTRVWIDKTNVVIRYEKAIMRGGFSGGDKWVTFKIGNRRKSYNLNNRDIQIEYSPCTFPVPEKRGFVGYPRRTLILDSLVNNDGVIINNNYYYPKLVLGQTLQRLQNSFSLN